MSKLDELIAELCPDGVEYKKLKEVGYNFFRGNGIKRTDITESGIPCVRYGEIYTEYGIWFDGCKSHTLVDRIDSPKYFGYGAILFAITGESIIDIAKCTAYTGHEKCLAGGDIVVMEHNEDPKYLSYALSTTDAVRQKGAGKVKSKVVHSSVPAIMNLEVPVPPVEVQREIVRVLDNFTLLRQELSAELSARRKQYEYYREKMLSNVSWNPRMVRIGDLGKWTGGKTPSMAEPRFWRNGTIPWISSKDMKSPVLKDTEDHITEAAIYEAGMNLLPVGTVAIVTRSGILKHTFPVAYIPFEATINQDIKALIHNDDVNPKYAAFALQGFGEDIRRRTKKLGGTVDSLDFDRIKDYEIPLPSMEIQNKIVDVLDNFEAICNDLNIGLPAEIEARTKQYEFYRDQLLTFAESGKTVLTDRQTDRQTDRHDAI